MGMLVLIRNLRCQMNRNPVPPKSGAQFIFVVQQNKDSTNPECVLDVQKGSMDT